MTDLNCAEAVLRLLELARKFEKELSGFDRLRRNLLEALDDAKEAVEAIEDEEREWDDVAFRVTP